MARHGRPAKEAIKTLKEKKARVHRGSARLIEPVILVLLREGPSHGWDLRNRINSMDIIEDSIDPAMVYRILRDMEKDGLISSRWDTGGPGAARRVYEVKPRANTKIEEWAEEIGKEIRSLEAFLKRLKEFTLETPN